MKHSIYIISLLTIFLLAGFFPSATCFSFAGKSVFLYNGRAERHRRGNPLSFANNVPFRNT